MINFSLIILLFALPAYDYGDDYYGYGRVYKPGGYAYGSSEISRRRRESTGIYIYNPGGPDAYLYPTPLGDYEITIEGPAWNRLQ